MRRGLALGFAVLWGCNAAFGVDGLVYDDAVGPGGASASSSSPTSSSAGASTSVDTSATASTGSGSIGVLQNGEACESAAQCISGHCPPQDGVCCDTACDLTCEACLANKVAVDGNDAVDGVCGIVLADTDPDGECGAEDVSTCGDVGTGCDGSLTRCRKWAADSECVPASCSNSVAISQGLCDGLGTCVGSVTTSCTPYVCNNNDACRTSCSNDSHCSSSTRYCSGSSCVFKKGSGVGCFGNNECLSGLCNNGVCA